MQAYSLLHMAFAGGPGKGQQLPDECKLYVGNLPPAYDTAMLRQLFEPHAKVVHTAVITEPGSGMSRGFGFVHIPDPAQVCTVRETSSLCLLLDQNGRSCCCLAACCGSSSAFYRPLLPTACDGAHLSALILLSIDAMIALMFDHLCVLLICRRRLFVI